MERRLSADDDPHSAVTSFTGPTVVKKKRRAPQPPESSGNQAPSPENTIRCVFIGQAASGKSKTLNFMFGDHEISPIERETGTEEILEFSAMLPNSENEKIVLIDTPGLGDMNSLTWDGRVIKTISDFTKKSNNTLPNAVLLFGRFDDNRMDGESSNFVKMLKAVYSFRSNIIDLWKNNLIVVLTHYMNGKKILRQDPTPKVQLVLNLVKMYLKLDCTPKVILAENEAIDWQLKESQGSYVLTNEELYPANLFEAIYDVCKSSGDKAASHIIKKSRKIRGDIGAAFKLTGTHAMASELESENTTANLAHTYNTSVSKLRDKMNLGWNKRGKSIEEPEFQLLLKNLEAQKKFTPEDLQMNSEAWIEFLQNLAIPDIALLQLLERVGTQTKNFDMTKSIGSGWYSLSKNFSDENPTRFAPHTFEVSFLPHRLPKNVLCELPPGGKLETVKIFSSTIKSSDKENFSIPAFKDGNHRLVMEVRAACLKKDICDTEYLPVDGQFKKAIKQLKPFVRRDRLSINKWREFFIKYGSHVVTTAYVGGTYTLIISKKEYSRFKRAVNSDHDEGLLPELVNFEKAFPLKVDNVRTKYRIEFSGGKQLEPMEIIYPPNERQISDFFDWKKTIRKNPICLKKDIVLDRLDKLAFELQNLNFDEAFLVLIEEGDKIPQSIFGKLWVGFKNFSTQLRRGGGGSLVQTLKALPSSKTT